MGDNTAVLDEIRRQARLPVGYGCARLFQGPAPDPQRVLGAAYDAGIRYFDTARSYGYGRAEAALGKFARGRRDRLVIATKVGVQPPSLAVRTTAKLRRLAGRPDAQAAFRGGLFHPILVSRSVRRSLKALQTDYVDLLLLHECRPEDLTEPLLDLLESLRGTGRIRAYGVATDPRHAETIARRDRRAARVVQAPAGSASRFGSAGLVVTHSAFSAPHGGPPEARIRRARAENPQGVILFSSHDPAHIRANVEAAAAGPPAGPPARNDPAAVS